MKSIFTLSIAICLSFFIANGQNVETIISKHIEVHGGLDNWKTIQSMKISGKFTSFSETKDFYTIKSKPNNFYSEFHYGIHKITEGYNGDIAWTINPWFEILYPRKAKPVEESVIKQKAEFCTSLFHYKDEGYKAEYKGKETVEGVEVFTIELTKPNKEVETWYLNTKTYLEHISKSIWSDFASPSEVEVYYSDFRKVGNVTIPFFVERTYGIRINVVQIEKVELNNKVENNIFNLPIGDEK